MGSGNPVDQAYGRNSIWSTLKTWIYFWTVEGEQSGEKREEKMTLAFRSEGKLPGTKMNPWKTKKDMTYPWPTHSPTHFCSYNIPGPPHPAFFPLLLWRCRGCEVRLLHPHLGGPGAPPGVQHTFTSSPFPVKSDNLLSGNDSDWGVSYQYWHSTFPTRGSHSLMRD